MVWKYPFQCFKSFFTRFKISWTKRALIIHCPREGKLQVYCIPLLDFVLPIRERARGRNRSVCGGAESSRWERMREEPEKLLIIVIHPFKNSCQEAELATCYFSVFCEHLMVIRETWGFFSPLLCVCLWPNCRWRKELFVPLQIDNWNLLLLLTNSFIFTEPLLPGNFYKSSWTFDLCCF